MSDKWSPKNLIGEVASDKKQTENKAVEATKKKFESIQQTLKQTQEQQTEEYKEVQLNPEIIQYNFAFYVNINGERYNIDLFKIVKDIEKPHELKIILALMRNGLYGKISMRKFAEEIDIPYGTLVRKIKDLYYFIDIVGRADGTYYDLYDFINIYSDREIQLNYLFINKNRIHNLSPIDKIGKKYMVTDYVTLRGMLYLLDYISVKITEDKMPKVLHFIQNDSFMNAIALILSMNPQDRENALFKYASKEKALKSEYLTAIGVLDAVIYTILNEKQLDNLDEKIIDRIYNILSTNKDEVNIDEKKIFLKSVIHKSDTLLERAKPFLS
jgi:hypothetical protein